jgi:hypothetical protein
MKKFDMTYLLLSVQRALLGSVIPALRAMVVDLDVTSKILCINFYYDCEITEEVHDLSSCIVTEIIADFPSDYLNNLDENVIQLNYPKKIPVKGKLVYLRKE